MKPLIPQNVQVFGWFEVIRAFAEHTGMSFHSQGCWGLDYSKICGEPDFRWHRILQHEQDYLFPYDCHLREYCEGDLQKILAESEKGTYQGKEYYKISFRVVLDYLVFHEILPEDNFFVTNLSV